MAHVGASVVTRPAKEQREMEFLGAPAIARRAKEALSDFTGFRAENVVSIAKSESGWQVAVNVVELQRIPNSSDVLATYAVELDGRGNVQGYRRTRRYLRGQLSEESAQ